MLWQVTLSLVKASGVGDVVHLVTTNLQLLNPRSQRRVVGSQLNKLLTRQIHQGICFRLIPSDTRSDYLHPLIKFAFKPKTLLLDLRRNDVLGLRSGDDFGKIRHVLL